MHKKIRANGFKERVRNNWLIPRVVQNDNQVFWCDASLIIVNTVLELLDLEDEVIFPCEMPENVIGGQGVTSQKISLSLGCLHAVYVNGSGRE
jgi:hypothetical protein